jgi:hypothetical protein
MTDGFDFLSGRLIRVDVFKGDNPLENFRFYYCVSFFETHVFGVFSQFNRIQENVPFSSDGRIKDKKVNSNQLQLDIYYYILTWDKIKEIFENIKHLVNRILQEREDIRTDEFKEQYRLWRNRIEHLLREYDDTVRNTYEHPKLEPMVCENIIMWGNMEFDKEGNIKSHVEGNVFSEVRKTHIERLDSLRIEFIDLILKYFSDKDSSRELLEVKKTIEDNIDVYVSEYKILVEDGKIEESLQVFRSLLSYDLFFSREGIPLSEKVLGKIHSMIWREE